MMDTYRSESLILFILSVLLLAILGAIVTWTLYFDVPIVVSLVGGTLAASLIGAILPRAIDGFFNPELVIGEPIVQRVESHSMGKDPILVRLPVSTKRGNVTDVFAKVKEIKLKNDSAFNQSNYTNGEFVVRGDGQLFWTNRYEDHSDVVHSDLETSEEVLNHMGRYHLSAADPIDEIIEGETELANIVMKIEDYPETFLADAIGTAPGKYADIGDFLDGYDPESDKNTEFGVGEFECEIMVGGEEVKTKTTTFSFITGPEFADLTIPN